MANKWEQHSVRYMHVLMLLLVLSIILSKACLVCWTNTIQLTRNSIITNTIQGLSVW